MDYQQTLDYLYSWIDSERRFPRTPAEFNLPRTAALLQVLGNPQQSLRAVVVAGTKGKGSTCALLEAILRAAGYRTGLWTSPHLHSYRERIQVDRVPISPAALTALVATARPAVEQLGMEQLGSLTTFELGFGLALRYFADQAVDWAVLEVGLGGRYDSANTVLPLLSIITSISYDHMGVLGDTLTEIASDKAGILKPGVPAITIPQHPEAQAAITQIAAAVGTPLWVADPAGGAAYATPGHFDPYQSYSGPQELGLVGAFQQENARLAVGAALLLRTQAAQITDDAIAQGLAGADWPGRMEIIAGAPTLVLDGAHNGDSLAKLVQALEQRFPGQRRVVVFGSSSDKDLTRMLPALLPGSAGLVLTHAPHPRALSDLAALAALAEPWLGSGAERMPLALAPDLPTALAQARQMAGPDDIICVTGSLFVVAAAREALGLAQAE